MVFIIHYTGANGEAISRDLEQKAQLCAARASFIVESNCHFHHKLPSLSSTWQSSQFLPFSSAHLTPKLKDGVLVSLMGKHFDLGAEPM